MDPPWALVMFFCHKDKKSRGGFSADKQEEEKIRVGGKTPTMGNWMLMAFKFLLQPFPSQHASCLQELGDTRYSQTSLYFQSVALKKCCFISKIIIIRKCSVGASLVAQWLRICLLMQGTQVRALVWEDPTCHGPAGPVSHNYWACASGACAPQREGPR